jgi:beta-lactamase class A
MVTRRLKGATAWLCVLVTGALAVRGQAPPDERATDLRAKLARELDQRVASFDGVMAVAVKDLTTGDLLSLNGDVVMPQASSIKIAVLVELLRQAQAGTLPLKERVEVHKAQFVGGSGVLQYFGDGTSAVSLRDLAALMMATSDNTATNILIDRLGQSQVNQMLRANGFEHTRLLRRMIQPEEERRGVENPSTALEMARLLELLFRGRLLDGEHTALAIELLKNPKAEPTAMSRGLPPGIALASKPGELGGVRCESGIVFLDGRPYILSVMTAYAANEAEAEGQMTEISRLVFSYFERLAKSNPYGARLP